MAVIFPDYVFLGATSNVGSLCDTPQLCQHEFAALIHRLLSYCLRHLKLLLFNSPAICWIPCVSCATRGYIELLEVKQKKIPGHASFLEHSVGAQVWHREQQQSVNRCGVGSRCCSMIYTSDYYLTRYCVLIVSLFYFHPHFSWQVLIVPLKYLSSGKWQNACIEIHDCLCVCVSSHAFQLYDFWQTCRFGYLDMCVCLKICVFWKLCSYSWAAILLLS